MDALAELRSLFIERCRADLMELERLRSEADAEAMGAIAHRLAGAAGSFGFPEIGECALTIDQRLRDGHGAPGPELEKLLERLRELQHQTRGA